MSRLPPTPGAPETILTPHPAPAGADPPAAGPQAPTPPEPAAGPAEVAAEVPRRQRPARGRRLARKPDTPPAPLTPQQRLLLLDAWRRSGLPAGDFAPLVGVSKHTLYAWHRKFQQDGPAGLEDRPAADPAAAACPRSPAAPSS